MSFPADPNARKNLPIARGVLDYFPDAIAAVAEVSRLGNEQHNPGQPLHWAREKSTDHADCIARHLIERGTVDVDGARHSAKLAWRALALLQTELEEAPRKKVPGEMSEAEMLAVCVPEARQSIRDAVVGCRITYGNVQREKVQFADGSYAWLPTSEEAWLKLMEQQS